MRQARGRIAYQQNIQSGRPTISLTPRAVLCQKSHNLNYVPTFNTHFLAPCNIATLWITPTRTYDVYSNVHL